MLTAFAVALLAGAGVLAPGSAAAADALRVADAWARATPPGASNAAAYAKIVAAPSQADRLTGAHSNAARAVELHTTTSANGVLAMQHLSALPIAAGATVELAPGGLHLMLIDIAAPLTAGGAIDVALVFEKAGEIHVTVPIIDGRAAAPAAHEHAH